MRWGFRSSAVRVTRPHRHQHPLQADRAAAASQQQGLLQWAGWAVGGAGLVLVL
jgi:hypothetical protein